MPYVTSTERYKTNRARLEQARASVLTVLRARFPDMPSVVNDTIVGIDDLATLQSLLARAATAADIAGFERTLGEHVR